MVIACSGCASIVSKSQWPVTITSNPVGAMVTVKNKNGMEIQKGFTPMTVTLSSSTGFFQTARYDCQFEKSGYFPTTSSLSASVNGWYIGNILFGGLIGFLIVDPATGAMWKLDETICGNMSPDPSQTANAASTESIGDSSAILKSETKEDASIQLIKLKELKDGGILTDEEYESRRKSLVDKL